MDIVCRQTNYTEEEAKAKLLEHNNDIEKVIREYIEPVPKEIKSIDVNQQIHKEINQFMNEVFKQPRL